MQLETSEQQQSPMARVDRRDATSLIEIPRHRQPSMARLCLVECRKLIDTRPGAIMIIVGALLTGVCGGGAVLFWDQPSLDRIVRFAGTPASLLIPVLATLLITGERSQRTALISYALVPRRERLLTAKLLTVLVTAVAVVGLCLLAGLIIAAVGPLLTGHQVSWQLDWYGIGWFGLGMIIAALTGYAVGAATGNAPAAIVVVLVWQLIVVPLQAIPTIGRVFEWLDFTAISSFLDGVTPTEVGQVLVGLAVWLVLPTAVGWWRQLRGEVR